MFYLFINFMNKNKFILKIPLSVSLIFPFEVESAEAVHLNACLFFALRPNIRVAEDRDITFTSKKVKKGDCPLGTAP